MDNSQSSDFDDGAKTLQSQSISTEAQTFYESLLASAKEALNGYENQLRKSTFPTYFTAVLEDTWTCITCSLEDQIKGLLSISTVPITNIVEYLNDSVFLLQTLSNFFKSILESGSISCHSMKTLPNQTGQIILTVFLHCKDSESLYGEHLTSVKKQLKDLFQHCHELQLTYLLILEKHFNFDLTRQEERDLLVEALKINLSIGKVVHSLAVKTMAEQWKAYTAICEKYSSYVKDTDVIVECSQILCILIKDNIGTAIEKNQDDKVIARSLKIASFTIKILLKICTIFKQSSNRNYKYILDLLQYTMINKEQCLEMSTGNSFASNVYVPSDCLLKELLLDEEFVNCVFESVSSKCDEEKTNDEHLLGLILVITSAMKCAAQNKINQHSLKTKLVSWIYILLPYSHTCFPRLSNELIQAKPHSKVFEHILTHTASLAMTMTNTEFNALEKNMIETVLGTDCVSALFSSYLWQILASYISPQLLFNQLIWLCTMYKKLDSHKQFYRSPQSVHLTHTISNIFNAIGDEDKLKFCKQFRIHDEDNITLWTALRIRNLPVESQQNAEVAITKKLEVVFKNLGESDSVDLLTQITNLAATCSFGRTRIEYHLASAWTALCQENATIVHGLDNDTVWFYYYVTALVALTHSGIRQLKERSELFVKVLHVISNYMKTGDSEMKLILTNILCKLATCEVNEHRKLIHSYFTQAFTSLLQHPDDIVRINLLITLSSYKQNKYLTDVITNIVKENSLQKSLQDLKNRCDAKEFKASDCKYTHKCFRVKNMEDSAMNVQELEDINLDGFHFELSKVESESEEPFSKRRKPNNDEADVLIRRLEEIVSLLVSQTVYTPEQLVRIRNESEKLKNICQ